MTVAGRPGAPVHPFSDPPGTADAVEVAEGVLWMRMALPMRLNHVNVYALDDGAKGWTVVDTGFSSDATRAAWDAALAGPLGGRPVWRVLATHHHPDHIGLAGWFHAMHGAEVWTSRTSWLFARMLQLDVQSAPSAEAVAFWRAAGMEADIMARRLAERPFNYADVVAPLPLGFRGLAEGDEVHAGGRTWDVRIGAGHAPDHVTLWSRDDPLVLAGDQVLPGITPNLGVWPTEPEADPVADFLASCDRLVAHARPDHLVLPGHQLPFLGLPARLAAMAAHHRRALDQLVEALAQPRTAAGCFDVLFGRRIGAGEYGLALGEAVAHLNRLRAEGRALRHRHDDGAWLWRATGDSAG